MKKEQTNTHRCQCQRKKIVFVFFFICRCCCSTKVWWVFVLHFSYSGCAALLLLRFCRVHSLMHNVHCITCHIFLLSLIVLLDSLSIPICSFVFVFDEPFHFTWLQVQSSVNIMIIVVQMVYLFFLRYASFGNGRAVMWMLERCLLDVARSYFVAVSFGFIVITKAAAASSNSHTIECGEMDGNCNRSNIQTFWPFPCCDSHVIRSSVFNLTSFSRSVCVYYFRMRSLFNFRICN